MNKYLLIFLFWFISCELSSQNFCIPRKVVVLDFTYKTPIKNANVVFYKHSKQYSQISNDKGIFILDNEIDSLKVSHLGYCSIKLKSVKDTFLLCSKVSQLNTVTITRAKKRASPFFLSYLFDYSINFIPKEKVAVFIPFKQINKHKRIKFLKYQLADVYGVKNLKFLPFKSCLYSVDDLSNKPDQLIFESEIVKKKDNTKWVLVDVSKYNLIVPTRGIFIVFEVLDSTYYSQDYILSTEGPIRVAPTLKAEFYNPKNINKCYRKLHFDSGEQDWEFIACHFKMEIEYEK
jgi:hypothetical protein